MAVHTTTNIRKATSIDEMRQIAANQIDHLIYELEERIRRLKNLHHKIDTVVNWESYERAIMDVDEFGDATVLTALYEFANEYKNMKAGTYF